MSLLHDQELADTLEAERLRRARRERGLDEELLEEAATAAIAAARATTPRPKRRDAMPPSRVLVEAAAARMAAAIEPDETPPALQREHLRLVLRTLRDFGVFGRRQLEAGS